MVFIKEYLWAILILTGFSFAGGFVIIPFQKTLKYSFFAMPLAGLFMVILGTSAAYNLLNLSVISSALVSVTLCIVLSIITSLCVRPQLSLPDIRLIFFSVFIIGIIIYITNYVTITLGHPGFLYMDGTDHLGYAHLADWLNNHLANQQPKDSVNLPYQSWPNSLFICDPRFGSYFTLAIISDLRNQSGMFAYDFTCSIILSATILAVASTYARSRFTFALLLVGLLVSSWFDYSRGGYLGKLLEYPACLFIMGLFLTAKRPLALPAIVSLTALIAATSVMHSYISTILFIIIVGCTFIIINTIYIIIDKKNNILSELKDNILIIGLFIGVVIASTGVFSRPVLLVGVEGRNLDMSWGDLLPRLFDLESQGALISGLNSSLLLLATIITGLITLTFLFISFVKQEKISASLLTGSTLLLILFRIKGMKWPAYQLIGIFYPYFLCAAVWLIDNLKFNVKKEKNKFLIFTLTTLVLISITLHLPRFNGALDRFSGTGIIKTQRFSKVEIDQLANLIGNQKVIVDVIPPTLAIAILVELGRRNLSLEWTPASWKTILGDKWPAPKLDRATTLWIESNDLPIKKNCVIKNKTMQYNLLECKNSL